MAVTTPDTLKVYVGYDSREDIAWQVCRHSILSRSAGPVEVWPIRLTTVRDLGLYTRDTDVASTEFSLTRFLTPYLAAHDGWSIFVDCDFVFTVDIREVLEHCRPEHAVCVVQHDYTPRNAVKMDGQTQTSYPRKNWSSFIAFNGAHPDVRALTPQVVNTQTPAYLHRFSWVSDDAAIGSLPLGWNFLEGEYDKPETTPQAVHYTNGGPWFENWQDVDFAGLWTEEKAAYERAAGLKAAE